MAERPKKVLSFFVFLGPKIEYPIVPIVHNDYFSSIVQAAVPNWLKDEIIKKQASIVGSAQEHPDGNSHSAAAQFHERHTQNGDPDKSIDSPRSTEDAEDDEVFNCFHDFKLESN